MTQAARRPPRWIILVSRGAPASLRDLAALSACATAGGVEVFLVWLGEGLASLAGGRLDDPGPSGASAASLFAEARDTGLLRHLACSAAAVDTPGGLETVRRRVDDVVGWPTVVSLMREAEKTLVW